MEILIIIYLIQFYHLNLFHVIKDGLTFPQIYKFQLVLRFLSLLLHFFSQKHEKLNVIIKHVVLLIIYLKFNIFPVYQALLV